MTRLGVGLRDQPAPGGEFERQRHAERDRLAVQQPVGETRRRLERVAEGVAEIEQHAVAGLALVARDDRGLGAAARPRWRARAQSFRRCRRRTRRCQFASSQAKKAASPSSPYLTTSA